nr:hypothetical protein [Variovorax boronicumulans]
MLSPVVLPRRARADLLPTLALRDDVRPVGRPSGQLGDVAQALLNAVQRLSTPERSPTQLELAHAAQVGRMAAERTMGNLVRSGKVRIVRKRWVAYRTSPVAEYAPVCADALAAAVDAQAAPARLAMAITAMAR